MARRSCRAAISHTGSAGILTGEGSVTQDAWTLRRWRPRRRTPPWGNDVVALRIRKAQSRRNLPQKTRKPQHHLQPTLRLSLCWAIYCNMRLPRSGLLRNAPTSKLATVALAALLSSAPPLLPAFAHQELLVSQPSTFSLLAAKTAVPDSAAKEQARAERKAERAAATEQADKERAERKAERAAQKTADALMKKEVKANSATAKAEPRIKGKPTKKNAIKAAEIIDVPTIADISPETNTKAEEEAASKARADKPVAAEKQAAFEAKQALAKAAADENVAVAREAAAKRQVAAEEKLAQTNPARAQAKAEEKAAVARAEEKIAANKAALEAKQAAAKAAADEKAMAAKAAQKEYSTPEAVAARVRARHTKIKRTQTPMRR